MISDKNKKLAQWAMDYALKNGCQAARVSIYNGSSTSFNLRNAKMDKLQQATENAFSVTLYVDGRYGNYSTNRLDKKELEGFIKNGIDATKYLAVDEARVLPDASRYYKGGKPDLETYDSEIDTLTPDQKVALAKNAAEEALGKNERIISVESAYSDAKSFGYHITSNGFEGENKSSFVRLSASISVRGEGEARPSDGWGEASLYFSELPKEGYGKTALERVLRKLGQKKVKSGKYTMVIDPLVAARLLYPLTGAISGSALQQKNSFLLDMLGKKIGSDKFTLIDNPHIPRAFGARYFDGEGVATEKRTVFDKGVLNTYFIGTYHAKKMNVEPTISGSSLLILEPGNKNMDEIISGVNKGILVTGFNGGNCNSSTGNFSYGVEGFLIENGKMTQPISEMNITGNMITLWSSLVEVGNDPRLSSTARIPTLVFDGVDFSGL
ncbi:TldD/PmbA family protein [Bacteroides sp. 214]|uniref:TldD/PmbA family protein n=1 Tax=Bacteroides sp. 214 TaxID=2302935 RepID=UPI0013CFEBED|nr:TldD/PmbA family protein [Bacteroides sp. 214]NDW12530.1 TldD/PmbA family protein [Bacteroides sp. 214]